MAIRNTFALNPEYLALCITAYISAIKDAAKGLIPGISREDICQKAVNSVGARKVKRSIYGRTGKGADT